MLGRRVFSVGVSVHQCRQDSKMLRSNCIILDTFDTWPRLKYEKQDSPIEVPFRYVTFHKESTPCTKSVNGVNRCIV